MNTLRKRGSSPIFIFSPQAGKNILQQESGQAIIEYTLILTVVVGIILGTLYQLNKGVKSWANNYFGDYLACLIESGELPILGGGSSGECSPLYKKFSLSPDGEDGSNGGGSLAGTEDANNAKSDAGKNSSNAKAGGANSGSGGSSGFGSFGSNSNKRFRANRNKVKSGAGAGEKSGLGADGSAIANIEGYKNENRVVMIPMRRYESIRGGVADEEDEKKEKDKTKVSKPEARKIERHGPLMIHVDRKITRVEEPVIEEFTFGNIFRYIVIAAIIIAILLFVGGQVRQITKSLD